MTRKHRNTFEGGVDQDTDDRLLPSNKYKTANNFTLTKDGNEGVLTTFSGFDTLTDLSLNTQGSLIVYKLTYASSISTDDPILTLDTSAVTINASGDHTNVEEFFLDLKSQLAAYNIGVYLLDDVIILYSEETISSVTASLSLDTTLAASTNFTNLVVKEISLNSDNDRLVLLWRTDGNSNFVLQAVHYNNGTGIFLNSGILFKGDVNITQSINPDNVIYLKELQDKHTFYWNDGVVPDKKLLIRKDLDPDNYLDWDTYLDELREEIVSKSARGFDEQEINFFPRPELYGLEKADSTITDPNGGKLKPTESIVFFYRMKRNNATTNISVFSKSILIPSSDLELQSPRLGGHIRYSKYDVVETVNGNDVLNRWSIKFKVDGLPDLPYDFIEPYVIHYSREGDFKVRKLPDVPNNKEEAIIEYNQDYDNDELGNEVNLSDLLDLAPSEDICQEQIVFKNRRVKANLTDTTIQAILDYDARAYRFSDGTLTGDTGGRPHARVYSGGGVLEAEIDSLTLSWPTDEKLDAINTYNDEYGVSNLVTNFADWTANHQYKYDSSGVNEGGEGPNVSYEFFTATQEEFDLYAGRNFGGDPADNIWDIDYAPNVSYALDNTVVLPNGTRTTKGHRNPNATRTFIGGEVYRFFLFFWRGDQPTVSKWIGDIKMPDNFDILGLNGEAQSKLIRFSIRNLDSISDSISGISIGYVPLDYEDRTVLVTTNDYGIDYPLSFRLDAYDLFGGGSPVVNAAGFNANSQRNTSDAIYNKGGLVGTQEQDRALLERVVCIPYSLKDFGIYREDAPGNGLFLKKLAHCLYDRETADVGLGVGSAELLNAYTYIRPKDSQAYATQELISVTHVTDVTPYTSELIDGLTGGQIVGSPVDIEGLTFNGTPGTLDETGKFYNATVFSYDPDGGRTPPYSDFPLPYSNSLFGTAGNGGCPAKTLLTMSASWNIINANEFSVLSLRKSVTNQYGGNRFVDRQANIVELASYTKVTSGTSQITVFPEGDGYLTIPDIVLQGVRHQNLSFASDAQSINGFYPVVDSFVNMHAIDNGGEDKVVSKFSNISAFGLIGLGQDNPPVYATTLRRVNGAATNSVPITDSVNATYSSKLNISSRKILGETEDSWSDFRVNDSKVIDPVNGDINKLVVVNDQLYVMQQDAIARQYVEQIAQTIDDASEINLGTGDVAGQHIYILRNAGVLSNNDVIQLPSDVVFRDLTRKKLFSLFNGEIRGISQELINDDFAGLNRRMSYDRETGIVFIPNYVDYLDSSDSYLIMYDDNLKTITSTRSFIADFGNSNTYTGLSNILNFDNGEFSIWNLSRLPNFPQSITQNLVEFVANPEGSIVKTFDNLFINMEAYTITGNERTDAPLVSPTFIRVQTHYQDTGFVACDSTNTRRLGRYWRFTIPRDQSGARIRDYWANVTIVFPTGYEIKLTEVITSYRPSNITRL